MASSTAAFNLLASSAIENEIYCHFPETALCRRLSWGGPDAAGTFLHVEFSPNPVLAAQAAAAALNKDLGEATDNRISSPLPHSKRRRTSLVEELERGLREVGVDAAPLAEHARQVIKEGPASSFAAWSLSSHRPTAPFAVSCRRCSSRVVSTHLCSVLEGYVVLWVESTLDLECTHTPFKSTETREETGPVGTPKAAYANGNRDTAQASAAHHASSSSALPPTTGFAFSLRPMGLRPLLHRLSSAFTAERTVVSGTATTPSSNAARQQQGEKRKRSLRETTNPVTRCTSVTLHSLHIVNADAVTHKRPASFALQSLLRPGWPTALECYPRHMVHFGLLCHAAWHASHDIWEMITGGWEATAQEAATQAPPRETGNAAKPKAPAATEKATTGVHALLPHRPDDAVLILGLGGNVLGQCLDAVLPPAVSLHIVEVEPAVLQACQEHHQFPVVPPTERGSAVSPTTHTQRNARRQKADSRASTTAPDAAWERATELIQQKSTTCVAFASCRHSTLINGGTGKSAAVDSSPATMPASSEACGEYTCFLQDAYVFLRHSSPATVFPPQQMSDGKRQKPVPKTVIAGKNTRSSRGKTRGSAAVPHPLIAEAPSAAAGPRRRMNGAVQASPTALQYSMIFLDCYDPDREHMMHEGRLIQLCARRLRPGGVLVVNAHVLPTVDNLRRDFFAHSFATVQVLRVSGCVQAVVVCVMADATAVRDSAGSEDERCGRFTVHQLRRLGHFMNQQGASGPVGRESRDADGSSSAERSFRFDATWLTSARRVAVPHNLTSSQRAVPLKTGEADRKVDFRVWQHNS